MGKEKHTVDELGYLMGMVHRSVRLNLEQVINVLPQNMRFEQIIVLRLAMKSGGMIPQSNMVGMIPSLDRHRVSRLCAEVEELGLIRREPNPENRRENLIVLEKAGQKLLDAFIQLAREANKHIFHGLSEDQVSNLFFTLQHIQQNLENNSTPTS